MTNAEAVNWLINITADIGKAEHSDLWHYEQALSEIREMLEDAHTETHEEHTETRACDLIDRQAAIEAIRIFYADECALVDSIEEQLEKLPSAQPEIIRCRECKHYQFADNRAFGMPVKMCEWFGFEDVDDDDFCSRAERRQDE